MYSIYTSIQVIYLRGGYHPAPKFTQSVDKLKVLKATQNCTSICCHFDAVCADGDRQALRVCRDPQVNHYLFLTSAIFGGASRAAWSKPLNDFSHVVKCIGSSSHTIIATVTSIHTNWKIDLFRNREVSFPLTQKMYIYIYIYPAEWMQLAGSGCTLLKIGPESPSPAPAINSRVIYVCPPFDSQPHNLL